MIHLDDDAVCRRLSWEGVLGALETAFRDPSRYRSPERVVIETEAGGALLTMPCTDDTGWFGVKQVAVVPDNPAAGLPGVRAHYTLMDPRGAVALSAAATALTRIRTAGASALAARYLAPADAATLLVCGTGGLAPWLAEAHARVRDYARVMVWGRDPDKAAATAADIAAGAARLRDDAAAPRAEVRAVDDLAAAVGDADVIACATGAHDPFVRGRDLPERRVHLDLVGAFTPAMAEADPDAVARCAVVVDTEAGARAEAGDLIRAAGSGAWSWSEVVGDLSQVVRGEVDPVDGDRSTLYESVGAAFEDLAVARLLLDAA